MDKGVTCGAELMKKVKTAPALPGCYLFRDAMGYVIYVGKAKSLKKRVRQYFQKRPAEDDPKLSKLIKLIADVETVITQTERDALLMEYKLIKQWRPWFNAQLKGEARTFFLRIDRTFAYPTLTLSEEATDDGAEYFGYFRDVYDGAKVLNLLNGVWGTPTCQKLSFERPSRPCINHQVGACLGVCGHRVGEAEYRKSVDELVALLNGEVTAAFERLNEDMGRFAKSMAFEKAAEAKAKRENLERLRLRSRRMFILKEGTMGAVFLRAYREKGFSLFFLRDTAALYRADFQDTLEEEALLGFLDKIARCEPPMPEGEAVASALAEIYADKLFVPLDDVDPKTMGVRLRQGYAGWMEEKNSAADVTTC